MRIPIGSGLGRPAGNSVSRGDSSNADGSISIAVSASLSPAMFGISKIWCIVGRRRSASMISTLRRYDSLSVSARLVAVSVLPSPGIALATITIFMPGLRLRVMERGGETPVLLDAAGRRRRRQHDLGAEALGDGAQIRIAARPAERTVVNGTRDG